MFSDQLGLQIVVEKRELLPLDNGLAIVATGYYGEGEARVRKWLLYS